MLVGGDMEGIGNCQAFLRVEAKGDRAVSSLEYKHCRDF